MESADRVRQELESELVRLDSLFLFVRSHIQRATKAGARDADVDWLLEYATHLVGSTMIVQKRLEELSGNAAPGSAAKVAFELGRVPAKDLTDPLQHRTYEL